MAGDPNDPYCIQCGETPDEWQDGICVECWNENQRQLDEHNARFDRWERMTDAEREREIRDALRSA